MSSVGKNKLRILHIVLSIGETNNTYNEHCLPLVEERDITICTYFRSKIIPPTTITLFDGNNTVRGFLRNLTAALNEKEYDIIHAHSPHVGIFFLIVNLFQKRKFMSSSVFTVHSSYYTYKLRNKLLLLPVFANFRCIICCSQASFDSFPLLFTRLAGERLGYVQNGVDLARVNRISIKYQAKPKSQKSFNIVSIGQMINVKNPISVISAFQESCDLNCRLFLIGDGPMKDILIAKSREVSLEGQITFTGLIPRDKVFEYLIQANLFISTSLGEGLPIAVLEAMALRCPVLLSDIAPHREIAKNVDFIPLIEPNDIEGFAREIKKFREMSEEQRAIIGQACRNLVEERFSLTAMHAGYERFYNRVINDRNRSISDFS